MVSVDDTAIAAVYLDDDVVGAVPFVVTGALYVVSPDYMSLLFTTNHGRLIVAIGLGWMSIGAAMMKKMISFDF